MRGAVLKRCLLAAVSESKNIRLIVTDVDGKWITSSLLEFSPKPWHVQARYSTHLSSFHQGSRLP